LRLINSRIFRDFQELGFDYLLNPDTGELHDVKNGSILGAHNLLHADLGNFIGLVNWGTIPIDALPDGYVVPVHDLESGKFIGDYKIDKCEYCFPHSKKKKVLRRNS
jgi:hypothetical protein